MQKPKLAGVALAVGLALSGAQPVKAVDIDAGKWSGSWDTTLSFGATWRVEDRDPDRIGHANLRGRGPGELATTPGSMQNLPGAWSHNGDDGNLNFEKDKTFSNI